jgi:hypothetical protein
VILLTGISAFNGFWTVALTSRSLSVCFLASATPTEADIGIAAQNIHIAHLLWLT